VPKEQKVRFINTKSDHYPIGPLLDGEDIIFSDKDAAWTLRPNCHPKRGVAPAECARSEG
jgi:hypothetical protein